MKIFAETDRLIMREIVPSDAHAFLTLDSDPLVHQYLGNKPVQSLGEIYAVIDMIRQQYINLGIGRWAVLEKESGNFIGWSGLKRVTEVYNGHQDFLDLGYRFIPKYWGKGYATESAKASIQYAFEHFTVSSLNAMVHVQNEGSNNVLRKCGFQFVNTFLLDNEWHNGYELNRGKEG